MSVGNTTESVASAGRNRRNGNLTVAGDKNVR